MTRAFRRLPTRIALLCACALVLPALAQSTEERLRALEREIEALRAQVAALQAQGAPEAPALAEVERRIGILAEEIEKLKAGEAEVVADTSRYGLGPAASKVYRVQHGVSIGGYGETLYENFDARRDDGTPSGETDTWDFLRAVVYLGYKFDDRFVLNSEIEFEHASTEDGGEVSVEFAYVDYLWKDWINVRAGMVLMPVGLINELHEPTAFLGARRPGVERVILPTTWRENGIGIFGDVGPLTYRTYLTTGLDAEAFSADEGIREGRQAGAEAKAEDLAWTGRLDYTARPGLLAGISAYYGGAGQGLTDAGGSAVDVDVALADLHLDWRWRGVQLRALAARTRIAGAAGLNAALGLAGAASIGERLEGGYIQLGYDVLSRRASGRQALIPYARRESWNTQERVPAGYTSDPANDVDVTTLGVAYQPIDPLTVKIDWQDIRNGAGTGVDQVNVALGYIF